MGRLLQLVRWGCDSSLCPALQDPFPEAAEPTLHVLGGGGRLPGTVGIGGVGVGPAPDGARNPAPGAPSPAGKCSSETRTLCLEASRGRQKLPLPKAGFLPHFSLIFPSPDFLCLSTILPISFHFQLCFFFSHSLGLSPILEN